MDACNDHVCCEQCSSKVCSAGALKMSEAVSEAEQIKEKNMENKTIYLTAQDVAEALNISQSMAYKLIREWNNKLKEQGKFVMAGRINERYFRQVVDVVA